MNICSLSTSSNQQICSYGHSAGSQVRCQTHNDVEMYLQLQNKLQKLFLSVSLHHWASHQSEHRPPGSQLRLEHEVN